MAEVMEKQEQAGIPEAPAAGTVALVDQHVHYGPGGSHGDDLAALGPGEAVALHLGGDGAVPHLVPDDLFLGLPLIAAEHAAQHHGRGNQNQEDDRPAFSFFVVL